MAVRLRGWIGRRDRAEFTGCRFTTGSADASSVLITAPAGTSAQVILNGCDFKRTPKVAYTQPTVYVPAPAGSARLTAMANRTIDKGSGAGTFCYIGADDWHRIIGNASVGWSNVFPTPSLSYSSHSRDSSAGVA
jgi:hypothetical protein